MKDFIVPKTMPVWHIFTTVPLCICACFLVWPTSFVHTFMYVSLCVCVCLCFYTSMSVFPGVTQCLCVCMFMHMGMQVSVPVSPGKIPSHRWGSQETISWRVVLQNCLHDGFVKPFLWSSFMKPPPQWVVWQNILNSETTPREWFYKTTHWSETTPAVIPQLQWFVKLCPRWNTI